MCLILNPFKKKGAEEKECLGAEEFKKMVYVGSVGFGSFMSFSWRWSTGKWVREYGVYKRNLDQIYIQKNTCELPAQKCYLKYKLDETTLGECIDGLDLNCKVHQHLRNDQEDLEQ